MTVNVQTRVSDESSLLTGGWVQGNLPVPSQQIEGAVVLGTSEGIQCLRCVGEDKNLSW